MDIGELGSRLQLGQATTWLHRIKGDPYAAVLCGFNDDPYPLYARVRARGRLWRSSLGTWVTADHGPAGALLGIPAVTVRRPVGTPESLGKPAELPAARVEQVCRRVLDGLGRQFDLVTDLAERIPVELIGDLLDLPQPRRVRLAELVPSLSTAMDSALCSQRLETERRMLAALAELSEVERAPAVADVRVTANLIANAVIALLRHPDEAAKLAEDPSRAALVIAETARWDPPVHIIALTVDADVEIGGQDIAARSDVAVLIVAANRDPGVFDGPERFAPDRTATAVLRAPFSHTHAEIALRTIAPRLPGLHITGPVLRRRRAPVTRSPLRCPVATA